MNRSRSERIREDPISVDQAEFSDDGRNPSDRSRGIFQRRQTQKEIVLHRQANDFSGCRLPAHDRLGRAVERRTF